MAHQAVAFYRLQPIVPVCGVSVTCYAFVRTEFVNAASEDDPPLGCRGGTGLKDQPLHSSHLCRGWATVIGVMEVRHPPLQRPNLGTRLC